MLCQGAGREGPPRRYGGDVPPKEGPAHSQRVIYLYPIWVDRPSLPAPLGVETPLRYLRQRNGCQTTVPQGARWSSADARLRTSAWASCKRGLFARVVSGRGTAARGWVRVGRALVAGIAGFPTRWLSSLRWRINSRRRTRCRAKRAERDGTPVSGTPRGFGWRGSRAVQSRRRYPRTGATGGVSVHGQGAMVPVGTTSCAAGLR
jgi:hypothetical protein